MTQTQKRRKKYPVPLEPIMEHPEFIAMPAAGAGMLLRLVWHFWLTECRPLPKSEPELRSIARAQPATWVHWREIVLRIFNDSEAELKNYFLARQSNLHTMQRLQAKASAVKKAQARERKAQESCTQVEVPALSAKRDQANQAKRVAAKNSDDEGFSDAA